MKILKRIIAVLLVVVMFVGSYLVSFDIFKETVAEAVYAEDVAISTTDPECYYLKRAGKNIAFKIINDSSEASYEYELTDEEGENVKCSIEKKKGSFIIKPPKNGYKEGETYTLALADNTYFADSDITNARKLVFTIDRKEIEHHKFTEAVLEVKDASLDLDENGNLIIPEGQSLKNGDIVFGKNSNDEYVAYKIVEADYDVATIELPAADEVYEELEIYGVYEWDVTQIEEIPNVEAEILDNFIESDLYNEVMAQAYVDDKEMLAKMTIDDEDRMNFTTLSTKNSNNLSIPRTSSQPSNIELLTASAGLSANDFDLSFEVNESENTATFEITIPIQPGRNGSFGNVNLKSHVVNLNLSATFGCSTYANIKSVKNWDLSYSVSSEVSWSVDITLMQGEYSDDPDLDDLLKKSVVGADHNKFVKKIADKLAELEKDRGEFAIDLFKWRVPVGSTGLFFEAEIELVTSFEAAANISIGNSHYTSVTVGIKLKKGDFEHYKNEFSDDNLPTVSLRGTIGVKLGVQLEMQLCFIDEGIANIGLTPQIGGYADLYVLAPIIDMNDFNSEGGFYAYLETGVYVEAELTAYVNLWGDNDLNFGPYTFEIKIPIPEEGIGTSEIALAIEPEEYLIVAENGVATLPDIVLDYYDVTSGVRKSKNLGVDEFKLYNESGEEISVAGNREISVSESISEEVVVLRAEYTHEDNGKVYDAQILVSQGKGTIEGQVSAFNRGNYTALPGATVSLYNIDDVEDSVASKVTGTDGKFSFDVVPGSYKLKISADKYKTLITTQEVKKDEVKYTEHLLLIDENQDGLGSARGMISNALNGQGVQYATIRLREEWNNKNGDYFQDYSTSSDSGGRYYIKDLPIGYYTLEATANNFVKSYTNILILDDADLVDFDFAMTPVIKEGEVRIILNWGATPSDLDSHLIGRTPSNGTFNVYYANSKYNYGGVEMANLDHDDTTSYGPETITILKEINGTYTYAVHDYSNRNYTSSTAMSYSGARVRVLIGGREKIEEFYIPTNKIGTYWTVFKIDSNYNITPVNTVSNTKPTA